MKYTATLIITFIFLFNINLYAQSWTGNVSADWNNAANWSSTPGNGDDIEINPANYTGAAASPVISSNSNFVPAEISISNGALLTISANLTTEDDIDVLDGGSIIVTAGTFSVNESDGGRLILELGGLLTVEGGNVSVGERLIVGEDAIITVNSGSVASGQRLIVGGGGVFIQNGGTVSAAATFAIGDGSVNNGSSYVLNDGILNITGEFGFENEAGVYEPTFIQNGGICTVDGDLFWFGEAPGSGTPKCILNGGEININGSIFNMPASTVNMYLIMNGGAVLNWDGPSFQMTNSLDSVIMIGNSTLNVLGASMINNPGVWHADNSILNINSSTVMQGSGSYQYHDINILSGTQNATLNYQSPTPLRISGDFNNQAAFTSNNNPCSFNGNSAQLISSLSNLDFFALAINNASEEGVTISVDSAIDYQVINRLELTDGKLNVGNSANFKLLSLATSSEGSDTSFVNGPMTKVGNSPFVFPIGKNEKWARLRMSAPQSSMAVVTAEYYDEGIMDNLNVNSPLVSVSDLEYWDVSLSEDAGSIMMGLYWEDASASNISDCNILQIAQQTANGWEGIEGITSGSCEGQESGSIISEADISTSGVYTLGYTSNVTSLDISICDGDSVEFSGNIFSETGTYTHIFTSSDGTDSIVVLNLNVTTIDNTTSLVDSGIKANAEDALYQWINCDDMSIIDGATDQIYMPTANGEYAVEITKNECVDTSSCVLFIITNVLEIEAFEATVYPNPFSQSFTINLNEQKAESIIIRNMLGQILKSYDAVNGDLYVDASPYENGVYIIEFRNENRSIFKKIIKR